MSTLRPCMSGSDTGQKMQCPPSIFPSLARFIPVIRPLCNPEVLINAKRKNLTSQPGVLARRKEEVTAGFDVPLPPFPQIPTKNGEI